MPRILSEAEIDALLSAITQGKPKKIDSFEELADYITQKRPTADENPWVSESVDMFQGPHVYVDKKNIDQIFNDISLLEPKAIYKLGGVEFIPVNICPHCKNPIYDEEALLCLYCGNSLKRKIGFMGNIRHFSPTVVFIFVVGLIILSFILVFCLR